MSQPYHEAKARNEKKKQFVFNHLSKNPCVVCGEDDPIVLKFNHKNPNEKEHNISHMIKTNYSLESLKKEIDKCEVMCANCHKRHTAKQFAWFKANATAT